MGPFVKREDEFRGPAGFVQAPVLNEKLH